MIDLKDYILEGNDMLGHDLKVGDWIQFRANGVQLWWEITEIHDDEKEKYTIKTLVWYGDKSLKSKVKEIYKINAASKSIYLLNKIEK